MLALLHVDALSVPLLERLADEGRMPTFDDLRRRGQWHQLETPATHLPAASYFSMNTGQEVGDHGLYFPFQWSAAEQRLRYRMDFPHPPAIWERLADAGKRSLVLDPYELGPPSRIRGRAASGWQMANILSLLRWAVPKGWLREYERRLGRSPDTQEVFGRRSAGLLRSLRRAYLATSRRLAELTTDVLQRERFDFAYVGFLGPHHAGHVFWDVSQLEVEQAARSEFDGTLQLMYEEADQALGRILAALPDDADVVVVSPLGMGPDTARLDLLGDMLALVLGERPEQEAEGGDRIWRLRAAVPTSLRAAVANAIGARLARELTARLSTSGIDWSTTRAFLLPSDENGLIRLNVSGRERDGIVDAGEIGELTARITEGLESFRDIDGGPAVAGVDRTADLFPGRRSAWLPDLVVRWAEVRPGRLEGVRSEQFGEARRRGGGTGRNGSHVPQAWALVVPGATRGRTPVRPARVTDIAATAYSLFGVDGDAPSGEPLLERP